MKYLRQFLDPQDSTHSWGEAPTKPTKPPEPGSSPDCPMLDVPADDWRWTVANWPPDRWSVWRRRVAEILAEADELVLIEDRADSPRADAEEIRAAERRAFEELTRFTARAL